MLTCKQIIGLASKELDTSIPWFQRMQMQLHLFICKNCKEYVKQLSIIQQLSTKIDDNVQHIFLPDAARQRIKDFLNLQKKQ